MDRRRQGCGYENAAEPERQPAAGENNAFRVVDLTRVPKVTEDDRVTGILATMGASSIVKGVDFGGVGDSNILKVLTGRLDDLSGPVDTSVFKMIITPSEDPSVFRAMIWAGYNTLEMEDMDYSEDGVALGANVLTQSWRWACPVPGPEPDGPGNL